MASPLFLDNHRAMTGQTLCRLRNVSDFFTQLWNFVTSAVTQIPSFNFFCSIFLLDSVHSVEFANICSTLNIFFDCIRNGKVCSQSKYNNNEIMYFLHWNLMLECLVIKQSARDYCNGIKMGSLSRTVHWGQLQVGIDTYLYNVSVA